VPGADAVLFVDDGRPREIYWMQLDGSGRQTGAIKTVPLGIEIDDPEDITTDAKYFYILGSNTREAEKRFGPARFAFDSSTNQVTANPMFPNTTTERSDLKEASSKKAEDMDSISKASPGIRTAIGCFWGCGLRVGESGPIIPMVCAILLPLHRREPFLQ
jgi:hypothetical protein